MRHEYEENILDLDIFKGKVQEILLDGIDHDLLEDEDRNHLIYETWRQSEKSDITSGQLVFADEDYNNNGFAYIVYSFLGYKVGHKTGYVIEEDRIRVKSEAFEAMCKLDRIKKRKDTYGYNHAYQKYHGIKE